MNPSADNVWEAIALYIGNIALFGIAVVVNFFVYRYWRYSNWRATRAGRSLMYAKLCLAALVDLTLATSTFGPDWPGRPYVRAIIFTMIAYTQARLLWSLLKAQAKTPDREMYDHVGKA